MFRTRICLLQQWGLVVFFDGTAHGLTSGGLDIDAVDIVGGILYFSTSGNTNPPGVGGTASSADIYSWNGTSFARVWDASASGLPNSANVDGLKLLTPPTSTCPSAGLTRMCRGLGNVQDEDIVYYNNGSGRSISTVRPRPHERRPGPGCDQHT